MIALHAVCILLANRVLATQQCHPGVAMYVFGSSTPDTSASVPSVSCEAMRELVHIQGGRMDAAYACGLEPLVCSTLHKCG